MCGKATQSWTEHAASHREEPVREGLVINQFRPDPDPDPGLILIYRADISLIYYMA